VVSLSLTTSLQSFTSPLVDYTIRPSFSPLGWLEYGESTSWGRRAVVIAGVLAGLTAGGLVLFLWLNRRR
jgi:hypothetical protein